MTQKLDFDLQNGQEALKTFQELMSDPTRVAIYFEIFRNPNITAKELMKVIKIQKTAMYYHLKKLEETKTIKPKSVKGINHYSIIKNFFDIFESGLFKRALKGRKKEYRLFSLLILNSLVQKEINRMKESTEKELKKDEYPTSYITLWFCSKNKLKVIEDDLKRLSEKIKALDKDGVQETITDAQHVYYWGFVNLT